MPNWYTNIILISGPSEDVSVLYKSLEEYDAEHTARWMKDWNLVNIGSWIKAKFSDKLPEFTEKDYELSYRNFIEDYILYYSEEDADDKDAYLVIYTYSALDLRMYALVKLIEVGFPKCIMNYTHRKSDESGYYEWYYISRFKLDYCNSNEDMYRTLINDYADIIKDNNIVIPALIDPEVSQIHELVESLFEYDESLCVYPFLIGGPEYDDKKVDNIESVGV